MDHAGNDIIDHRRLVVGTKKHRRGRAEFGSDESTRTCGPTCFSGGSGELADLWDPRSVFEHLERRQSGDRSQIELILKRINETAWEWERLRGSRGDIVEFWSDDESNAQRRQQSPGA